MIHTDWLILATLTYLPIIPSLPPSVSAIKTSPCPERSMFPTHRCLKPCREHQDCLSPRKRCFCDGDCGKSCVNPNSRCRHLNGRMLHGKVRLIPYNKFGAVAEYSCDRGYVKNGPGTRVCQGDGNWSGQKPLCVSQEQLGPTQCAAPPDVPIARYTPIKPSKYSVGDSVTYACREGYETSPSDINTAFCVSGGTWLGPNMTCSLAGCSHLSPLRHGNIEYSHSLLVYGSTAKYTCSLGYRVKGAQVRTCLDAGDWSGPKTVCEPVRCGRPPDIKNAIVSTSSPFRRTMGTRVSYVCKDGYILRGEPYRTCTQHGIWRGPDVECKARVCGYPGEIAHGTLSGTNFSYPSSVAYRCIAGYTMLGSGNLTCNSSGFWTGTPPICQPVVCGYLDPPQFGEVNGYDYTYKATLTFTCLRGFMNIGSSQRTCRASGEWSGRPARCVESRCGPVPVIYNGYTDGHSYGVGSIHFFRCNIFTTFDGHSMSTECLDTGRWSHAAPTCWGQCQIMKIKNGTVVNQLPGMWLNHNSTILYKCDAGLKLSGESRATCVNGTWSSRPTCSPQSCPGPPPNIDNGMRIFFREQHGDRVRYECLAGYRLRGSPYVQCQFGRWVGQLPICQEVYCKNPGGLENGTVFKLGTKGRFLFASYIVTIRHGARIVYECASRYELVGPDGATCVDSIWRPNNKPTCSKLDHTPYVHIWRMHRQYY